jgi:hypothetical protein
LCSKIPSALSDSEIAQLPDVQVVSYSDNSSEGLEREGETLEFGEYGRIAPNGELPAITKEHYARHVFCR